MKIFPSFTTIRNICLVLVGISCLVSAQAAYIDWTGATDSLWSDSSNWSPSTAPPGTGDIAYIRRSGITNRTITVGTVTVDRLSFQKSTTQDYTFESGTITISKSSSIGLALDSEMTADQIVNNDFVLSEDAAAKSITFQNYSPTALVTIGGNITGGTGGTAGAQTIKFLGDGDAVFSGILSDGGATSVALIKEGLGKLTISGANTYAGATTANGGILTLDFSAVGAPTDNIIKSGNTMILDSGELVIKGAGGAVNNTQTLVMTNSAGSAGSIVMNNNGGTGTTTLALSSTGLGSRGSRGTVNIDLSQGLGGGGSNVISTTATAATLGWATVKDAGGTGFAAYNGSNVVRLTGQTELATNSNASATDFLVTGAGATLSHDAGDWSANSLTLDTTAGAATLDIGGDILSLTQNGVLLTGANDATVQNGQVGATGQEVVFHTMGSGILNIAGTVSGGSGSLTKNGDGILTLSGANSYTGRNYIYRGVVRINSADNLGDASSASNAITLSKGTLESTSGTYDLGVNRAMTLGRGATIQTTSGTLTVSGNITNSGDNWEVTGPAIPF